MRDETASVDPAVLIGAADPGRAPCEGLNLQADAKEDQLRNLMGIALSAPTPDAIMMFIGFTSRMKSLGPYNMLMVFAQRPGAIAVASREEWFRRGQTVRPDAIPILVLKPRGPIAQVFELADTLPPIERDPLTDALGCRGPFDPLRLSYLRKALIAESRRRLRVEVVETDFGAARAGQITHYGLLAPEKLGTDLAGEGEAETLSRSSTTNHWRILLNRRLQPAEQFATLLHELGHLFCGHVGPFSMDNPNADEFGWPDRSDISHPAAEIEAELVAWHICEREGLACGSPLYLRPHLERGGASVAEVDLDRVIRAIARICQYLKQATQLQRSASRA